MTPFHYFQPPPSLDRVLGALKKKPASLWERRGRHKVMDLFRFVYRSVPAYRKLLRGAKIDGAKIRTLEDFKMLPVIDKDTYLRKYHSVELFPNRDFSHVTTFAATSGSTGDPFHFPRGEEQDQQYEYVAELFLKNQFEIHKYRTLGIIGFGLGIWIGGIFTYKNFNKIAAKGYPLALVPAGANIETFLRPIASFGHRFEQILLMGYPPFVKDAIDEAESYGVDWKKYRVRILTAAEGYSEKFRDYLVAKTFIKNPLLDTINIYGTVELGTMAHETAFSNLIRRIAVEKPGVFRALFPDANHLPTLAQYHPYLVYFEEVNGEVIASGYGSSIPLLRYRFPDRGGVIPFETMVKLLKDTGIDIFRKAEQAHVAHTIMRLPFVYVYDRSDHAVSLVGIVLYPEYIRDALHEGALAKYLTGKFTMLVKYDAKQNQLLELHMELRRGAKRKQASKQLVGIIRDTVVQSLIKHSTEYRHLYTSGSEKYQKGITPKIILWPFQHHAYFKPGGKQKWTIKGS